MLHVGLDLSRKRVDVCVISDQGELVDELAAPFDQDGLCRLNERVSAKHTGRVRAVVESMNGARLVHDTLEAQGWDVLVADAQRVKGLAPLACKTDKIDARVLAELPLRDLVPAIWLPDPQVRRERELARDRRLLDRGRDRARAPPPLTHDAMRLPRPVPARDQSRRDRPSRADLKARAHVPALGAV